MKFSLDTVGYGGYFTNGEHTTLEDAMQRASSFGYDAVCIYAHRPIGFPMDIDSDRRKRLVDLAWELDLELGAVVCCTNFMKGNHVLLYPQEKEILYVRDCIRLAKDMGMKIVRVLAAFHGYFQNPYAGTGYGNPAFESFDPDFVRYTVRRMKGRMVYSHSISIAGKKTVGGVAYGWDEVTPGSPRDPCPWPVFLETCKEIGYDGYLSHEQCSPMIVQGHKIANLSHVDARYQEALAYLKPVVKKLDYYTGHK